MTTARERYLQENGDEDKSVLGLGSTIFGPAVVEPASTIRPRQAKPTVQYNVKLHLKEGAGVIYMRSLSEPTIIRQGDSVISMSCDTWINGHIPYLRSEMITGVSMMREKYKEDPANYQPTFLQYDFN